MGRLSSLWRTPLPLVRCLARTARRPASRGQRSSRRPQNAPSGRRGGRPLPAAPRCRRRRLRALTAGRRSLSTGACAWSPWPLPTGRRPERLQEARSPSSRTHRRGVEVRAARKPPPPGPRQHGDYDEGLQNSPPSIQRQGVPDRGNVDRLGKTTQYRPSGLRADPPFDVIQARVVAGAPPPPS